LNHFRKREKRSCKRRNCSKKKGWKKKRRGRYSTTIVPFPEVTKEDKEKRLSLHARHLSDGNVHIPGSKISFTKGIVTSTSNIDLRKIEQEAEENTAQVPTGTH
jgi:hypothetical protein